MGVFPSNFVSTPITDEPDKCKDCERKEPSRVSAGLLDLASSPLAEETDKCKDRERKELCRVLFPYEASNEDELTLMEGDVIALISKDAPDKGWWKGELKGQVGLFPDNFVELITVKPELPTPESNTSILSVVKHHATKRSEKAHARKSLDVRSLRTESVLKKMSTSSSSSTLSSSSTSQLLGLGGGSGDKKGSNIIPSLKRLVSDGGSNNGHGSESVGLGEELDEVGRGEGAPLSHLTASRAKAPRRRLPSTQHLKHQVASSTATTGGSTVSFVTFS